MYVAHKNKNGETQTVFEHLTETAKLSKKFGESFGEGELAEQIGLLHDIGKYSKEFQKRIMENGPKVDHSTAGAMECKKNNMPEAALCVAGHHTGIPDFGGKGDSTQAKSLIGRLKRMQNKIPDYSKFSEEIRLTPQKNRAFKNRFELSFYVRMLYSCLVDADFLDTERAMCEKEIVRGNYDNLETLLSKLEENIEPWLNAKNEKILNKKRTEILKNCLNCGNGERGMYTLTVPTGGGKTISSLAFALKHAVKHGCSRIVYVIPYTSIIEQTAKIFRDILGKENVLEHHSNIDFDDLKDDEIVARLKLSTENWDAPIIVTTNVQFFESLYANKSSACRKLHNLANSVIIFDEAQMIPLPYLKPCVSAIELLVKNYGATAILCTATQPSLQKFFSDDCKITEICPDVEDLYEFFKRTTIKHIGTKTLEEVAVLMTEHNQVLSIVNTKKDAKELYMKLPEDERIHLSNFMTPSHKMLMLKEIRNRLKDGKACRVVSTSLIEAGVDVDFPCVFREEAGLDSVVQAAGRCNREGDPTLGKKEVYVFESEAKPPNIIEKNVSIFHEVMEMFDDLSSLEAIKAYFDGIHELSKYGNGVDKNGVIKAFNEGIDGCSLPFEQVASKFRLIDDITKSVLIPIGDEAESLTNAIENALKNGDTIGGYLRKASKYMVNIYDSEYKRLCNKNVILPIGDKKDLAVLACLDYYSDETGLITEIDGINGFWG
ncbi:MAG: CRISPR-associated helicase Cas3' [Oscillospiraceae bacterium]